MNTPRNPGRFTWLNEAHLEGANLRNAHLEDAWLEGATFSSQTRWPEGFDPLDAGAVLVEHLPEPPREDAVSAA
jgi:hypothetical protein